MRKLVPSVIALTMAGAFASFAQAQTTSEQPMGRAGASPAEQPRSTNSREEVKSEAQDAAHSANRPMGQAGASPAQQPRSMNSRADVMTTPRATDTYTEQSTMPHLVD